MTTRDRRPRTRQQLTGQHFLNHRSHRLPTGTSLARRGLAARLQGARPPFLAAAGCQPVLLHAALGQQAGTLDEFDPVRGHQGAQFHQLPHVHDPVLSLMATFATRLKTLDPCPPSAEQKCVLRRPAREPEGTRARGPVAVAGASHRILRRSWGREWWRMESCATNTRARCRSDACGRLPASNQAMQRECQKGCARSR